MIIAQTCENGYVTTYGKCLPYLLQVPNDCVRILKCLVIHYTQQNADLTWIFFLPITVKQKLCSIGDPSCVPKVSWEIRIDSDPLFYLLLKFGRRAPNSVTRLFLRLMKRRESKRLKKIQSRLLCSQLSGCGFLLLEEQLEDRNLHWRSAFLRSALTESLPCKNKPWPGHGPILKEITVQSWWDIWCLSCTDQVEREGAISSVYQGR